MSKPRPHLVIALEGIPDEKPGDDGENKSEEEHGERKRRERT